MTFLNNPLVRLTLFVFLTFTGVSFLVTAPAMNQVLTYVLIPVSVAVAIKYLAAYLAELREGRSGRSAHLVGGISYTWIADATASIWAVAAYITGWDWMRNHTVVGIYILLLILGGVLHLTAPRGSDGRIPTRAWWILGITIVGGFILGMVMLVFNLERGLGSLAPL